MLEESEVDFSILTYTDCLTPIALHHYSMGARSMSSSLSLKFKSKFVNSSKHDRSQHNWGEIVIV